MLESLKTRLADALSTYWSSEGTGGTHGDGESTRRGL